MDCLLVNTTGELRFFYEPATVVFVGKSLTAIGGQNPIEPGALGKAMVFGPNMQNFADITRNFVKRDAAVQVADAEDLETALADLLANEARRAELGRNALKVVAENLGALRADGGDDFGAARAARHLRRAGKINLRFRRLTKRKRLIIFATASVSERSVCCMYVQTKGASNPGRIHPRKRESAAAIRRCCPALQPRAGRSRRGTGRKNQGTGPARAGTGPADLQRHQRDFARERVHARAAGRSFRQAPELEIEVVDQAEVDNVKKPDAEEEETSRLDILDDPVRMYLKQMGQVALLTREQEVEISKRIEAAETEFAKIIYSLGFAGKEHIALAEKLLAEPPRERFDRVVLDKKVDSRDAHLRAAPAGRPRPRSGSGSGPAIQRVAARARQSQRSREHRRSKECDRKLQAAFPKFCFKQKVVEEMALVAENIHDKLQYSLRALAEARDAARIQRAAAPGRGRAAENPGAGGIRADAGRGFSQGVRRAARSLHARRSRPRPKWSRPTCASSFPSPKNTPTAACRSSI